MSQIARWSYKNVAVVTPFLSTNMMSGVSTYGTPYPILCTWIAANEEYRTQDGHEFVSRHIIYSESSAPKYLDKVVLRPESMEGIDPDAFSLLSFNTSAFASALVLLGQSVEEQIRSKTQYDMAMFNDVPDYKLVT